MITVRNRKLIVPQEERLIGTVSDNNSETRVFAIDRFQPNGVDMSSLAFGLDMEYEDNAHKNATYLDKEWDEEKIYLTWGIIENDVAPGGVVFVQIEAHDQTGAVKWHSIRDAFYIDPSIGTGAEYNGDLSAFQRMEAVLDEKLARLSNIDATMGSYVEAESARATAELERVDTENARIEAETARQTAESERIIAEQGRRQAEELRRSAEAERLTAEEDRITAEDDRAIAEAIREQAEIARQNAEQSRVNAENEREEAETKRESDFASAIEASNEATERANQAADDFQGMVQDGGAVTPSERVNWNAAYDAMHDHANKEVIDAITAEQVTQWDEAVQKASDADTEISELKVEVGSVKEDIANQVLVFNDVSVTVDAWTEDTPYTDYPYRADVACEGVTANYKPDVTFDVPDAISGVYAPVAATGAGVVSIYASEIPADAIVIPTISCVKAVGA